MYNLKSNQPSVYKQEKLNRAGFENWSHSDYQVFLLLVSRISGVDESGIFIPANKLQRRHTLKASELTNVFGIDKKNIYKKLETSCKKLMRKVVSIKSDYPKIFTEIAVCTQADYQQKEGIIQVTFSQEIMPYLAQVKERFTLYNLKNISGFKSIYTTRLYELIQDFKSTGWMVKSIDQLRYSFGVNNKFSQYNGFKKRTFEAACKEINQIHNLNLGFEEIKEVKKVVSIKFTFDKFDHVTGVNEKTRRKKRHYIRQERDSVQRISPPAMKNKKEISVKKRGGISSALNRIFGIKK